VTDPFNIALGISIAAGLLTIIIVVIVTHISSPEREEREYEAPPRPVPPPAPHRPAPEPRSVSRPKSQVAESVPGQTAVKEGPAERPEKPKKRLRKKGKIERYPECFGTKYLYEKCKRDCGVEEECLKAIKILEPYS